MRLKFSTTLGGAVAQGLSGNTITPLHLHKQVILVNLPLKIMAADAPMTPKKGPYTGLLVSDMMI